MSRIRIKPADTLFSRLIRSRDGWRCQRCMKKYEPPTSALHNSHFIGRGAKNTRFDPENCDALCYGCHSYWETKKGTEYRDWKIQQLGQERFDALEERGNTLITFGAKQFKEKADELRKIESL